MGYTKSTTNAIGNRFVVNVGTTGCADSEPNFENGQKHVFKQAAWDTPEQQTYALNILIAFAIKALKENKHNKADNRTKRLIKILRHCNNMQNEVDTDREILIKLCKEKMNYIYEFEHAEDIIKAVLEAYETIKPTEPM
jgi:hypothetical protein